MTHGAHRPHDAAPACAAPLGVTQVRRPGEKRRKKKSALTHCRRAVALLPWLIVRKLRSHRVSLVAVGAWLAVAGLVAACDDLRLPVIVPDGGNAGGSTGSGGAGATSTTTGSGGEDHIDCAPPTTECEHGCYDLGSSNEHCGSCDTKCTGGASCAAGSCVCGDDRTRCGDWCVDLDKDASHCGGCNHACGDDHVCLGGTCFLAPCPDEKEHCGDLCVDPKTDNQNCGGCGHACTGGSSCWLGDCVCPAGEDRCEEQCVDLATDPKHCGECGHDCVNGVCSAGDCE